MTLAPAPKGVAIWTVVVAVTVEVQTPLTRLLAARWMLGRGTRLLVVLAGCFCVGCRRGRPVPPRGSGASRGGRAGSCGGRRRSGRGRAGGRGGRRRGAGCGRLFGGGGGAAAGRGKFFF